MFEKFADLLNAKLSGPMTKLASERHLLAVRDGIIATLPLIIVGSFFLIIANPPLPASWGISKFLTANAANIVLPYRMTMFIMTLYAVFGIGHSLAESYGLDGLSGSILAETAYLLTIAPVNITAKGAELQGWALPMAKLGSAGMFVGIITAIIAVEIYHFMDAKNLKIKMPDAVPPAVAKSFENLTPAAVVILVIGAITFWFGFDWHGFIGKLITPLVSASDSLGSVILIVFLTTFFWCFGIHGASIVGSLARPVWLILLEANTTAMSNGQALPNIAPEPFYQWFIWIGGSGATLAPTCLLFAFRNAHFRQVGKMAIVPAIFNVNEPFLFGLPVIANPVLAIPCIAAPMICGITAWFAVSLGWVCAPFIEVPWVMPGFLGAILSTQDWHSLVLFAVNFCISGVIWWPFLKYTDSQEKKDNQPVSPS